MHTADALAILIETTPTEVSTEVLLSKHLKGIFWFYIEEQKLTFEAQPTPCCTEGTAGFADFHWIPF